LAFANFLVWRLRTGACGVGACGFWRYRMPTLHFHPIPLLEIPGTPFGEKEAFVCVESSPVTLTVDSVPPITSHAPKPIFFSFYPYVNSRSNMVFLNLDSQLRERSWPIFQSSWTAFSSAPPATAPADALICLLGEISCGQSSRQSYWETAGKMMHVTQVVPSLCSVFVTVLCNVWLCFADVLPLWVQRNGAPGGMENQFLHVADPLNDRNLHLSYSLRRPEMLQVSYPFLSTSYMFKSCAIVQIDFCLSSTSSQRELS